MPKVSVIVPIYNVERYIEHCVRSLFAHTFNDIVFIFIDGATPDRSLEIVRNVANVRIINHKKILA